MPADGYDYVVVGAGAAGCVVAARLSEDPGTRVLLLEAGRSDRGVLTRVPLLSFMASATPSRNWSFVTEPVAALDGRRQTWNQGRLIGGSSSINGMVHMRGQPREYHQWSREGCAGWSFAEVLPFFRKSESNSRGPGPLYGDSGPIRIQPANLGSPVSEAFLDAVRASGFAVVEDLNASDGEAFGHHDWNIGQGVRASSARGYLHPIRGRRNLTVATNTSAVRLITQKGRVTGVEALWRGRRRVFRAAQEVILCAGALKSPILLMMSGIGPAEHLAEMGIPTVVDSPQVGENLKNHPAYVEHYYCTEPVTAYGFFSPLRGTRGVLEYLNRRTGPLAEAIATVGGCIRSDPAIDIPDAMVLLVPSLLKRASGSGQRVRDLLPREHGFQLLVSLGRPHSSGRVRLRSDNPNDAPRIFPNYFDDPRDLPALARSIRTMRRVMREESIARYIDARRLTKDHDADLASIERDIRSASGSLSHPSGTCRMGADALAVVDPLLRVRGIGGLRVADNSIMPTALNAATHAPALMIGEMASALIAGSPVDAGTLGRQEVHHDD